MKRITTLLLILALGFQLKAQVLKELGQIPLDFTPDYIDFSPNDHYMVLEHDKQYQVWDVKSATKILEGEHAFTLGCYIKDLAVSTGSGYIMFENEQVFMTFDYQHNSTLVKAYSLIDGKSLWETDQLHMAISVTETILTAHGVQEGNLFEPGLNVKSNSNKFYTKDKFIDRLINYLPERQAITINGKNGLQLVDVKTGKVHWIQKAVSGGIGELLYDTKTKRMLAIQVPNSEGAIDQLASKQEVLALDAGTGKLLWRVEYSGTFQPGFASVIGNTLVLPYLELTFIDVETGEEIQGDIKTRTQAAKTTTKVLGNIMAIDRAVHGSEEAQGPNKYNRLIPRKLHFNSDGKLCYFTTFNEEGQLGTGMKKGYLVIDIHKDKVEKEEYGILGNQWTVVQDEMVDGLFYVKASGNLNRTMITALDAKTGDVVFETKKASNSADITKLFNPFMVSNGRIVDIVSQGIFIHDAKTGVELSYTRTKDLGIGRVKYSEFYANGILLFGTKGLAIIDFEGNHLASVATKSLLDVIATKEEVWVLENKTFTRIHSKNGDVLETNILPKTEHVFLSPSGNTIANFSTSNKQLSIKQQG